MRTIRQRGVTRTRSVTSTPTASPRRCLSSSPAHRPTSSGCRPSSLDEAAREYWTPHVVMGMWSCRVIHVNDSRLFRYCHFCRLSLQLSADYYLVCSRSAVIVDIPRLRLTFIRNDFYGTTTTAVTR